MGLGMEGDIRKRVVTYGKRDAGMHVTIGTPSIGEASQKIVFLLLPNPESNGKEPAAYEIGLFPMIHSNATVVSQSSGARASPTFLVLSAGHFNLAGRDDTAEGITRKLVLSYYVRSIRRQPPSCGIGGARGRRARERTLCAHHGTQDLDLGREYSVAMDANATYTELTVEALASLPPHHRIHTSLFDFMHWAARLAVPLIKAGVYLMAMSTKDAAEHTLEHGDELQKVPTCRLGSSKASHPLWGAVVVLYHKAWVVIFAAARLRYWVRWMQIPPRVFEEMEAGWAEINPGCAFGSGFPRKKPPLSAILQLSPPVDAECVVEEAFLNAFCDFLWAAGVGSPVAELARECSRAMVERKSRSGGASKVGWRSRGALGAKRRLLLLFSHAALSRAKMWKREPTLNGCQYVLGATPFVTGSGHELGSACMLCAQGGTSHELSGVPKRCEHEPAGRRACAQ
ncbi:hypothetical protein B0H11DRAFT_2362520 [Mycena galericulata]|nr:hypothetical protein B0H11DRAFT_2362520 [Mycena galericulata]